MDDCIGRNKATQREEGFLFLGNTYDEKRPKTKMTNVLETGCYSCDLKSHGEPFQAVWKKAKAEKPYCFIVSGSVTTAGCSDCAGVCSLRRDAGEPEDIWERQL